MKTDSRIRIKILDGWGGFIKFRMKEEGLSIRKTAKMAGISPSYISHLFKGDFSNIPSEKVLIKIADALDIDRDTMLIEAGRIPDRKPDYIKLLLGYDQLDTMNKKTLLEILEALQAKQENKKAESHDK